MRAECATMLNSLLYQLNRRLAPPVSIDLWSARFRAPSLDRFTAIALHRLGLFGASEQTFLRRNVRAGMSVVDVGSNQGIYTLLLSKLVRDGMVIAFEPDPLLFAALRANLDRNNARNVTAHQVGAGRSSATLSFERGSLHLGNNRLTSTNTGTDKVRVEPLDAFVPLPAIDFMKIDVQGWELEVLLGARDLIGRSPNLQILFEFWPWGLRQAGTSPEELLNLLEKLGFALFELGRGGELESFERTRTQWSRRHQFCNLVARK
jgi:FkbM family methyltransferase